MNEITPTTPIRHRHADGTEHSHGGQQGFEIGGQVIEDHYGDHRGHSHSTMSLVSGERGESTGPVVWSERDAEASQCCVWCGVIIYESPSRLGRYRFTDRSDGTDTLGSGSECPAHADGHALAEEGS